MANQNQEQAKEQVKEQNKQSKQEEVQEEVKKVEQKQEKKGFDWRVVFISVLLNVAILCGYHFGFVQKKCYEVKTFDLLGYINLMRSLYLQGVLSDTDVIEITNEIKKFLEKEGSKKGVVIVAKQFVLNDKDVEEIKFENEKLKKAFSVWKKEMQLSKGEGNQTLNIPDLFKK